MWILILLFICVCTNGHIVNRVSIKRLQSKVKDLEAEQESIFIMLDSLETNMTAQISKIQGTSVAAPSGTTVVEIDAKLEERLSNIEGKVEAIKNYLIGEKRGDIQLRKKSEEVIKEMKEKVKETENVIEALKNDVTNSLADFEDKIKDVNKTANVKINANGAVLYGGIGSACTTNGGECMTKDSECRDGRCQCLPGLSYDIQAQSCVGSCGVYGETYQSVSRRIIRGFNDKKVESVSLGECKIKCIEEEDFKCRSFDYFPQWRDCYMSASVKSDAPDEAWEYNSEGYHFQRDCQ